MARGSFFVLRETNTWVAVEKHQGGFAMKNGTSRYVVFATMAGFTVTGCMQPHPANTHVITPQPDHPYYEIQEPVVSARLHAYPDVRFNAGDRVTVFEAGGCVNTGGRGRTWKDYVSPKGDQTARLYHGLIWIPGAMQTSGNAANLFVPEGSGPMRLQGALGKTYVIGPTTPAGGQGQLYLGYEDDHYRDNGYYKDREGTDGQCVPQKDGQGRPHVIPAFVKIRVESAQTPASASTFRPFDVVATGLDANDLLRNPIWAKQNGTEVQYARKGGDDQPLEPIKTDALPNPVDECGSFPTPALNRTRDFGLCKDGVPCQTPCSTQAPSFDVPIDFSLNKWVSCFGTKFLETLNGHANWAPVYYDGQLHWAGEQAFDEDADIMLQRRVGDEIYDWSGYSSNAKSEIEIEMAGYETWDHFGTEWFKKAWAERKQGHPLGIEAQVIGLMSLDCVHGCKVELHPVFAVAIHKSDPTRRADGTWDDYWAIFARNSGNEGWCSHDQHYLDRRQVTFVLPGPVNSTGVGAIGDEEFKNDPYQEGMTEFKASATGLGVFGPVLVPGGAKITLTLGDPENKSRINGFLHLRWTAEGPPHEHPPLSMRDLSNHQEEVDIEGGSKRANPQLDTYNISRLTIEPTDVYMPANASDSIEDTTKANLDRSKLKASCKDGAQKAKGNTRDYCGPSKQLKREH